jgi:prepilin-type N-terminal cleavage/methylation domain-containing protein
MQNRKRKGFTLIELLIVVVIIGILAAIAIPKFANTKGKAYKAAMKGDLRNLATAQEGYAADNGGAYLAMPATVGPNNFANLNYAPSTGVTVTATLDGTNGWYAVATHQALPIAENCAIFYTNDGVKPAGADPATASGEPKCD